MKKIILLISIILLGLGVLLFFKFFHKQSPPPRPNIMLISFDTLRPDRLSCYGYTKHQTPNFDNLAGEGCLFTEAITQFPATRQSHMTIMTSLHPSVHGLTQERGEWEDNRMNPALKPLAESLQDLGYYNIGITEGCFVAGSLGFNRGFDEYYDERFDVKKIFSQASAWLRKNREKRFFMFLHTYETHVPYDPPEEFLPLPPSEYFWEHKMVGSWEYNDRKKKGELELDPTTPDFLKKLNQLYDGEVLFTDRELGRLIETLKKLELYDDLLLIVISDHGESLGERGEFGHGYPRQNNMEAVLIVKFPNKAEIEQPRVIGHPAGLIDIPPLILDLLGLKSRAQPFQGKSFLSLSGDQTKEPEAVYSEFSGGAMAQDGRWKYIRTNAGKEYLFDLENDPDESRNLLSGDIKAEAREVFKQLKAHLLRIQSENKILRKDFGPRKGVKSKKLDKKTLKSLGYL